MKTIKVILTISLALAPMTGHAFMDWLRGRQQQPAPAAPPPPVNNVIPPSARGAEGELRDLVGRVGQMSLQERISRQQIVPGATTTARSQVQDLSQTLPEIRGLQDIDTYSVPVMPNNLEDNTVVVEIFSSTEKATDPRQGQAARENWLNQAAREFNTSGFRTRAGIPGRVAIRRIASGIGYQFIVRQTLDPSAYVPDAFSPSSAFWVRMAEARGIRMTKITDRLIGNEAGIVIKRSKLAELGTSAQRFTVRDLVDAVDAGRLRMGYTNPFESTTGLNFLSQVLVALGEKLSRDPLHPDVAQAFRKFQEGVPKLYETTLQMRDAIVSQSGDGLDAMVMEYSTFAMTEQLRADFEFIPFGERHDNPLYAVGDLEPAKLEILRGFSAFIENRATYRTLAQQMGFNRNDRYSSPNRLPTGEMLIRMQSVWKEEKSAGAPVAAIFLADISGSMRDNGRMAMLNEALSTGANFIKPENKIGLIAFDDAVTRVLPIDHFQGAHRENFVAMSQGLRPVGGTAMYDGIAVALHDLVLEARRHPQTRLVLIVLSDGESNRDRLQIPSVQRVIQQLRIPTYIFGLEAQSSLMADLQNTARASGGDAFLVRPAEVRNRISALLNSQL